MSLTFSVKVDGDLDKMMRAEVNAMARAVQTGIRGATNALKEDWRGQVRGAGLGNRLANAVRAEVYPKDHVSPRAAGLVWTKAPVISDAFERGVTIRSQDGFWLAIPRPAAGAKGVGGRKITPAEWERRTGRRLRMVYRRGRSALLVDDGTVITKGLMTRMSRKGFHQAFTPRGFKNRTIPIFALVPQVTLKKRLDLMGAGERVASTVPGRIVSAWRD